MNRRGVGGRPTKYEKRFCTALVEHMRKGMSFESFGAEAGCCKDTLYLWLKKHREFSDARKLGEPLLEAFYLKMGQSIATGQMRRLVSEEPVIGADGRPARDPQTGAVLTKKNFESAKVNPVAWIFLCKNMLGWRDRRDVNVAGQPGGAPITTRRMTREERIAEIERLRRSRGECGED